MGEYENGVTSIMTGGYDYISVVRCKNCNEDSIHDYGPEMEFEPCPHCGYAVGIREKPVEKQLTLEVFE